MLFIILNSVKYYYHIQMGAKYGVGGKLSKAVQSFYIDRCACVRVGNYVTEWFLILD